MPIADSTLGRHPLEGQQAHVRNVFLRLLGVMFVIAFWSLGSQVVLLYGRDGLLPARELLELCRTRISPWQMPTVFWCGASDTVLQLGCVAGAVLGFGLILDLAPFACLLGSWLLYLSYATIGQDFLSFQWDHLLLETALCSLFVTPWRSCAQGAPQPSRAGRFLMVWLLFRLYLESGLAKWCSGDASWRDLTAMASYYETAPIPTRLAWFAHQLPLRAHQACTLVTFLLELGLPLLFFGPRALKPVVFVLALGLQLTILLTANYGFFNYLSMALCLWLLDDRHLGAWLARLRISLEPRPARARRRWQRLWLGAVASLLVVLTAAAFVPVIDRQQRLGWIGRIERALAPWRSINCYHLFASMTGHRDEVIIEGSDDGRSWTAYEFRYKPGEVMRPPPWVAPHQPRVDFQMWFLALRPSLDEPYFARLLRHLLIDPASVASVFATMPFADLPPRWLRVSICRYRFTDAAQRRQSGAWWQRQLLWVSRPLTRGDFAP
ncbi:MAG: lipase maturation factor family protein [Planctomycetota bacterium]